MSDQTSNERPLILVTNDDGIDAAGLSIMARALEAVGQVVTVAPHEEQSAVGHGISLSRPMRITSRSEQTGGRYAVTGSPADAVLVGLFHLCSRRPQLVVSGINHGLNLGTDVFYSGTIAGALEGVIHGIPGLAVSQEVTAGQPPGEALLQQTAAFAALVARQMLADPPPAGIAISINAPCTETERYVWTRLGQRVYRERVEQRADLRGVPYYWVGGPLLRTEAEPGTDSHAVDAGRISLTPLTLNLTGSVPPRYDGWSLDGYNGD